MAITCPRPVIPTAPTINPTMAQDTATDAELLAPASRAPLASLRLILVVDLKEETTIIATSPAMAEKSGV